MATDLRQLLQSALGNAYTIERELGGGGMSRVFVGTDVALNRAVVVKVLSPEQSAGVSGDRFRREIQLIAGLQHPHIVPILSAGSAEGALYYVMPYRGGESLGARIARAGPLPVDEVVRILRELLDAVAFAHSHGVIHRDVKPDNVLLETGHAVLADFGVSKALSDSGRITSTGVSIGTPMYMSPEQVAGDDSIDQRSDLYSVGLVAYEMLTGTTPFSGSAQEVLRAHLTRDAPPVRTRRSDAPALLAELVDSALRKDPGLRPANANEMRRQLDLISTTPDWSSLRRSNRKRGIMWFAVVVAAIVGVVAWRLLVTADAPAAISTIAVAPFAVPTGDTTLVRLGQNLVSTISTTIDGVGDVRAADPVAILNHTRSNGAALSLDAAAKMASKLGAQRVLHGTLVREGSVVRAEATLYELTGRAPIARLSAAAHPDSLTALSDSLAWQFLRAVWRRGRPPTPNVSSITTHSAAALREFLDGERLFARGQATEASDAYERAVRLDTTFWFAHYRYEVARSWYSMPLDTSISSRLGRHVHELPDRERRLVSVRHDSVSITGRLRALSALTTEYRDYAPAWQYLADELIHRGSVVGHHVSESIGPWQEVVRLMPDDVDAAGHLTWACVVSADFECLRIAVAKLDSLVRADPNPAPQALAYQRPFVVMLAKNPSLMVDSLWSLARRDSVYPGGDIFWTLITAPMAVDNPDVAAALERGFQSNRLYFVRLYGHKVAQSNEILYRAMRGDWSGIDTAYALHVGLVGPFVPFTSPLGSVRFRLLGELQNMVSPDERTANWAATVMAREASPGVAAEARWIIAVNALLRKDTVAFRQQLRILDTTATAESKIARRSVRALAAGLSGNTGLAAESLLALEREHGDQRPKVIGAFAADRLLGAQWLALHGQPEAADSLLRFVQGALIGEPMEAALPIAPLAYLQRSRIAKELGNNDDAVRFAKVFLMLFDKAPASQQVLIDEARATIQQLSDRESRRPK